MRLARLLRLTLVMLALALGGLALATPASAAPSVAAHPATAGSSGHHATTKWVKIKGGHTSLTVASATAAVLKKNGVSVTPIKPASAKGATFSFPITGGHIDPKTAAGTIYHDGGLQFKAGKIKLGVEDFTVDTIKGVLTARVSGTHTRIPLLKLDASKARISSEHGYYVVSNVKASLTKEAAAALNKTFHVKLFKAGLPSGTAKVSARV